MWCICVGFLLSSGFGGEYKIHNQLLLSLTKVSNVDDRRNCSFMVSESLARDRMHVVGVWATARRVSCRSQQTRRIALTTASKHKQTHVHTCRFTTPRNPSWSWPSRPR